MAAPLTELVEAGDLNGLLRAVDGLCASRSWDELLVLADRCMHAIERGKQLWPITEHIDYRLALEAPGDYAARVLRPDVGRFAHGPLTEVAASTHKWEELAPHIETPQAAAYVAQERVLRQEVLTGDARAHPEVLELPLQLEEWEPTYCLAVFRADHAEVSEPWEPKEPLSEVTAQPGSVLDEPDMTGALIELVQPWTSESNGAARAIVVDGSGASAAAALTYGPLRIGRLEPAEALQRMAWAAASGGAHGRRRGAALGRSMAWFTAAVLAGLEWPAGPHELGTAVQDLGWFRWDEGQPEEGWILRLAVENERTGRSAAIGASDFLEDVE